jgi:dCMP deaminase
MQFAHLIAKNRSTTPTLQVGAVIVTEDNTQVLAIGYNGMAKGEKAVLDSPEPGQSGTIHAETNALIKCDFNNPKRKIMYLTHSPCRLCARLIVNAGIWRVVYDVEYRDTSGIDLMRNLGVEAYQVQDAILMADEGSNRS